MIAYIRAYSAGYVVAVFDGSVLVDHEDLSSQKEIYSWLHANYRDVQKVENIPA